MDTMVASRRELSSARARAYEARQALGTARATGEGVEVAQKAAEDAAEHERVTEAQYRAFLARGAA